jgi:hypothetical protein
MNEPSVKPLVKTAVPQDSYHNPYKTLIRVQASIDPTLAYSIQPPEDFYEPGSLWKLTLLGTTILPSGGGFLRRIIQIGDLPLSVLQGSPRGNFPVNFYDEVMFEMYQDQLFDVQSKGVTAISPTSIKNETTTLNDSQPAQAEWATSGYDSPNADRTQKIDIYLFASPIADPLTVFLNTVNLTRLA